MSFLKKAEGYVPQVSGALLPAGTHDVVVRLIKEVTDHQSDLNGTPKADYRFKNIHIQIAVLLATAMGTILRRLNTEGYVRWAELSDKLKAKYGQDPDTGFAVDKKGNRLEDPKRTADCQSIFNQFLNSLQKEDGTNLIDELAGKPIDDLGELFKKIQGCKCRIVVETRVTPKGDTVSEVKSFKRISAKVAVPVDSEIDTGDLA